MKKKIFPTAMLVLGLGCILTVFWNCFAPEDWCWLGFWKGAAVLGFGFYFLAVCQEMCKPKKETVSDTTTP